MWHTQHCPGPAQGTAGDSRGPASPVLTLDRVTKRFQRTTALSKISVTIPPGQFVAIIGCSGAGKTTLLHCLSRGTVVTEGSVRFGTCDLAAPQGEVRCRGRRGAAAHHPHPGHPTVRCRVQSTEIEAPRS